MTESGWRTLVIQSKSNLHIANELLIICHEEQETTVPLTQIRVLIIENDSITFSAAFLQKIIHHNIKMIVCDKRHHPCGELLGYADHTFTAGNIAQQSRWKQEAKDLLWKMIIQNKIGNQIAVLEQCDMGNPEILRGLSQKLLPGDPNNSEAVAAKFYFMSLFGNDFHRRTDTPINAALNYGYSIILSHVNRSIAAHGYHTALGIHHHSEQNSFNFSCDLMEPFRPFVDNYVYFHQPDTFTIDDRKLLISLMNSPVLYDGKQTELQTAIDQYVMDCISYMNETREQIGRVAFIA